MVLNDHLENCFLHTSHVFCKEYFKNFFFQIQSFFRGLICRRRWHSIVQDYIRSPHAESMRKRNCVVFQLVCSEEEYVEWLSILVSAFYRPCKMAASSKNKPLSHEEVNSIFLNRSVFLFYFTYFVITS